MIAPVLRPSFPAPCASRSAKSEAPACPVIELSIVRALVEHGLADQRDAGLEQVRRALRVCYINVTRVDASDSAGLVDLAATLLEAAEAVRRLAGCGETGAG